MTENFVLTLCGPGRVLRTVIAFLTGMGRVGRQQSHHDEVTDEVFARVEFCSERSLASLRSAFRLVENAYARRAEIQIYSTDVPLRLAVLVSRLDHCLRDLLAHQHSPALPAEIATVIGNHSHLRPLVEERGIPFVHISWEEDPDLAAQQLLDELKAVEPDFLVMARFMRILPPAVVDAYRDRVINVHHAPLPAFAGARPARRGAERGVRYWGATAHFAVEELDHGAYIDQQIRSLDVPTPTEDDLAAGNHECEQIALREATGRVVQRRVLRASPTRVVVLDDPASEGTATAGS